MELTPMAEAKKPEKAVGKVKPIGRAGGVAELMTATRANELDQVKELITMGVDVNIPGDEQRTPLHEACAEGFFDVANVLLLDGHANVNAKDEHGHTPLDDATMNNRPQMVELLKLHGGSYGDLEAIVGPFFKSVASGDTGEAGRLIDSGVEVNCRDMNQRTPLHLAVSKGDAEMVKLLLSRQANPKAEDRFNLTPMDEAERQRIRTGHDPITNLFEPYRAKTEWRKRVLPFVAVVGFLEIAVIVLIGTLVVYNPAAAGFENVEVILERRMFYDSLPMMLGLRVMVFMGIGYLFSYLRKNAFGGVATSLLVAAIAWQWFILADSFWANILKGDRAPWPYIQLGWRELSLADLAAGSALLTYGVMLGKVSPLQIAVLSWAQTIFFALNYRIMRLLRVSDVGGSMYVFVFGACFAWGCSLLLSPYDAMGNNRNSSIYQSDLFSFIGTALMWTLWPFWNAALGSTFTRARIIENTVLALMGSSVAAFLASVLMRRGKLAMADIQLGTLAGGVAIGACADMLIGPGPALAIGFLVALYAVAGSAFIQGWCENWMRVHDTTSVMHVFGVPGFLGGIAACIAVGAIPTTWYSLESLAVILPAVRVGRHFRTQAALQFAFIWISAGVGFATGALSSLFVCCQGCNAPVLEKECYTDEQFWHVPRKENPGHFDEKLNLVPRIVIDGEGAKENWPLLAQTKLPVMGGQSLEEAPLRGDTAQTSPSPRSEALDQVQQLEATVSKLTLRIAALERNSPTS